MTAWQLNLQSLFAVLTLCALVLSSALLTGWAVIGWLALAAIFVTALGLAWAIAPRATSHLVLFAGFAASLLAVLTCGIQQSRTMARQARIRENLRRVAIGLQEQEQFTVKAFGTPTTEERQLPHVQRGR